MFGSLTWNVISVYLVIGLTISFLSCMLYLVKQSKKIVLMEDALIEAYKISLLNTSEMNDQAREDFIKFISDSREWAFDYIEDVQQGLGKFVSEVDPYISHFDEFGDVLSTSRPDYETLKQISKSFKELKSLLPKEEVR